MSNRHPQRPGPTSARSVIRGVSWTLASVAALGVAAIMMLTVTDVARRNATGRAIAGTVDLSELTMVAVVFLAFALTQREEQHVSVTLVTTRLPNGLARWVRIGGLCIAIVLISWLCIAAAQEAWRSYNRNEFRFGLLRVVVWPARAMIPVGCLALTLELAVRITDLLRDNATSTGDGGLSGARL